MFRESFGKGERIARAGRRQSLARIFNRRRVTPIARYSPGRDVNSMGQRHPVGRKDPPAPVTKRQPNWSAAAMLPPLMKSPRFAPLFWCQFFAAFGDNFLRNALVFVALSGAGALGGAPAATLSVAILI